MLLLLLRKRTLRGKASPELIAELERQLYGAIAGIRLTARTAALDLAIKRYGAGLAESGMHGRILDLQRAKRIAKNVSDLALDTLDKGGPVIKRVDQRLVTIAVSENSGAYNDEHRFTVTDRAREAGLIEVWDSQLDARVCEHCAELDGTESFDGDFPGGVTPGNVHANCRCTSHFVHRSLLH